MTDLRPVIVTGARGFVGKVLLPLIAEAFRGQPVVQTVAEGDEAPDVRLLDVTDAVGVDRLIAELQPAAVVHLAAMSFVPDADADPRAAYDVNLFGTVNLAEAVLRHAPSAQFIHVSSSEVYGRSLLRAKKPVDESCVLDPANSYAVTKAAADLAVGQLSNAGLKAVRFRPFNHIGPGQSARFVISGFVEQIVAAEFGVAQPTIKVGNLDSRRDFLDVRDVARAYVLALQKPEEIERGSILNLASGESRRIGDMLEYLLTAARVRLTVEQDMERMRPAEIPVSVGDAGLAKSLLGWQPRYSIEETLDAVLEGARSAYAAR